MYTFEWPQGDRNEGKYANGVPPPQNSLRGAWRRLRRTIQRRTARRLFSTLVCRHLHKAGAIQDKYWGDDFEITPEVDEISRQIEAGGSNASSSVPAAAITCRAGLLRLILARNLSTHSKCQALGADKSFSAAGGGAASSGRAASLFSPVRDWHLLWVDRFRA